MIVIKAIILAAGYATRLYPLTLNTPKALLKIKGTTIIEYIINKIESIKEINEIIIVTNNKFYKSFVDWEKNYSSKVPISVLNDHTNNNEERLGAIGDINFAIKEKNIKEDIIVIASDNYFSYKLVDFYKYYKEKNTDCIVGTIASKQLLEEKRFGIALLNSNDKVINFEEKPDKPKSNIITYASYIYKKETLPLFQEYISNNNNKDAPGNFISWLCTKKPVYLYKFTGFCYDIGTIEIYNELNK